MNVKTTLPLSWALFVHSKCFRQQKSFTGRRKKNIGNFLLLLLCFVFFAGQTVTAQSFVHPGLLHKQSDLDRMKEKVAAGEEPWKSSYDILVANSHSSLTRAYANPVPSVIYRGFDGTNPENYASLFRDVASAYATALRWKISGDEAYAEKSISIMNAWSASLTAISGTSDKFLAAGIYGYQFANAAEIMRTYSGWVPADFDRFKNMMLTVFYPMNKNFLETHNGACISNYYANWDLANMSSMISIGVLCDRRDIYNEAVDYFKNGAGNGSIKNMVPYLYGELGQFQESGRDQGHAMLCVALSASFCEMAWNQGDDFYGYDNNRLLKAYEYIARYNLGYDVPFTTYSNCIGVIQTVVSPDGRGNVRPAWEIVYNHYVNRKGLNAPYISLYAQRVRPEGGGGNYGPNSGGYDQLGYGSLTFSLGESAKPGNQTIAFPAISTKEYNAPDFDPGATASSGLPVFYSVLDPNVASVNADGTIHILKPGTTVIYAQQIGNDTYYAAPVAQQILTVNKVPGTNDGTWSNANGTITTAITSTSGNPTLTWLGQTFAIGNLIKLTNIVPGGFTPNTTYYVVFASGSTFRLSATAGGSPITPTTTIANGTGERIPSGITTSTISSTGGSPDLLWPGQTLVAGEHVKLTGTVPGGFTANTVYTVVAASENTFQLALKPGGTAINATNTITNGSAQRFQKWLVPTNWSGGVLPSGNNATATFGGISFANIPGVTLEDNITIGTLSYAAGGTSELTLASGLNDGKLTFATLSGMPSIDMTLINSGARKLFMGSANNNSRIPLKVAGIQGLKVKTPIYGNSGSFAGLRIQAAMNWDEFSGPLNVAQGNIELHNTTGNTSDADDVLLPKKQRLILGSEGTAVLIFTGSGNAAVKQTIGALDGTDDAYIISKTSMTARPATLVIGADDQDGNFAGTIGRGPLDTSNHSFFVDLGRVDLIKIGTGTQVISGPICNGNFISGSGVTSTITGPNSSAVTVNKGKLILSGNNLYQGVTNVNGGTLIVNGSTRSALLVNAGIFSGSGSSSAAITVGTGSGTGAAIAPGNSVGTFTTTGSIFLNSDATYALELNSDLKAFDKIVANGVTLNNAKLSLTDLGNNSLLSAESHLIIDNSGNKPVSGTFQGLEEGSVISLGVNSFTITYKGGTGNDVALTILKHDQIITFNAIADKIAGDSDFDPQATASSQLPITYISSNQNVATIVNGKVHIIEAGTAMITAMQEGDDTFAPATPKTQTLTVYKLYYVDADGDGLGKEPKLLAEPVAPVGYSILNTDCDDANPVQLTVAIPDVYAMNSSVDEKNTLYIGYGPSSLTVTAKPSGGTVPYTYQWTTGETSQSIPVSKAGTYKVNIVDIKGCTATASISINILDVTCGRNSDKVMICHNGKTICVASSDVQDHLEHGCKLGSCASASSISLKVDMAPEDIATNKVTLYPNPATDNLNIRVNKLEVGAIIQVYNASGALVIKRRLTSNTQVISIKGLSAGIYYVQVKNGEYMTGEKVIKQ
ncbi:alginate lyase family protein [Chitinophagaceae bacterium LB-8]|uniref:Alginate lyase family protein n=1 Tax=Paraflavisolibacter caeni TaxID=2982496 RepID=A0A9X3BFQ9_9BACT|nr:alginate lyase family protein [Paraflavisolibacter caeni]MCU7549444.1 alginate lyase family protein [Paraflavisolibacter caeni]